MDESARGRGEAVPSESTIDCSRVEFNNDTLFALETPKPNDTKCSGTLTFKGRRLTIEDLTTLDWTRQLASVNKVIYFLFEALAILDHIALFSIIIALI